MRDQIVAVKVSRLSRGGLILRRSKEAFKSIDMAVKFLVEGMTLLSQPASMPTNISSDDDGVSFSHYPICIGISNMTSAE